LTCSCACGLPLTAARAGWDYVYYVLCRYLFCFRIITSLILHSFSAIRLRFFTFLYFLSPAVQIYVLLPSAVHTSFNSDFDPHLVFSTIEILQFKLQNMISPLSALLFGVALASPVVQVRTVTSLNQAAFEEAQQRDATATRAFSSTAIKVRHLSSRTDTS
jgi:hypothetical protein